MLLVLHFPINFQTKLSSDPEAFFPSPPPPPGLSPSLASWQFASEPHLLLCAAIPRAPPALCCVFLHSRCFQTLNQLRGAHMWDQDPQKEPNRSPRVQGFPKASSLDVKPPFKLMSLSWRQGDGVQPILFSVCSTSFLWPQQLWEGQGYSAES